MTLYGRAEPSENLVEAPSGRLSIIAVVGRRVTRVAQTRHGRNQFRIRWHAIMINIVSVT